jgi:hypothetical protein
MSKRFNLTVFIGPTISGAGFDGFAAIVAALHKNSLEVRGALLSEDAAARWSIGVDAAVAEISKAVQLVRPLQCRIHERLSDDEERLSDDEDTIVMLENS